MQNKFECKVFCFICSSFIVQAVMAPVSHLLVYYVTDAGEPISDVITFDVKLLLRQVKHELTIH
jgi:hypothetical protein